MTVHIHRLYLNLKFPYLSLKSFYFVVIDTVMEICQLKQIYRMQNYLREKVGSEKSDLNGDSETFQNQILAINIFVITSN